MFRKLWAGWLVILLCFNSGCATVVSGKSQDIMIRSEPSGAKVVIDDMMTGMTPMVASLIRKKRHQIKITKDGYNPVVRATTRGFNWWYLGNIILGGLIGLIVDPITGAMYEVKPDAINVVLEEGAKIPDAVPIPFTATTLKSTKVQPGQ